MKIYKSATKINDSSVSALLGLTLCELSQSGKTEQIKHQVEFLLELQETPSPTLLLMQSKLAENAQTALSFLNAAAQKQLNLTKNQPYGASYLKTLDPDFLVELIKEYLQHISHAANFISHTKSTRKVDQNLLNALAVLKEVAKSCPGLQDAAYLLAKLQYMNGDVNQSTANLERILNGAEVICNEAYLLLAQIQVHSGLHARAAQSLEMGLSHDFNVRENPLYHFILGLIEKEKGNLSDAVKSFDTALKLVSVKAKINDKERGEIALTDKASLFVQLIMTLMEANRVEQAAKLLQDAVEEFQGTEEEGQFAVLNADLLIAKGDVKAAVDVLSLIMPDNRWYHEAKVKLANIFLNDDIDNKMYIQCYREIADSNPSPDSYLLLGDAYLEILGRYDKGKMAAQSKSIIWKLISRFFFVF